MSNAPSSVFGVEVPNNYRTTVRHLLEKHEGFEPFRKAARDLLHSMQTEPCFEKHDATNFKLFVNRLDEQKDPT